MRVMSNVKNEYVLEAYPVPFTDLGSRLFYCPTVAGHFRCDGSYYTIRDGMEGYLLLLTLQGRGILSFRGGVHECPPGSVLLIPCMELHDYRTAPGETWEFLYMHVQGLNLETYVDCLLQRMGPVMPEAGAGIRVHMETILELARTLMPGYEEDLSLEVAHILRILVKRAAGWNEVGRDLAVRLAGLIQARYDRPLSLQEMADRFRVSRFHLIRAFRAATGFTPHEYLKKYRVRMACALLLSSDLPVARIAECCGFGAASSLSSAVRAETGRSPLAYRRKMLGVRDIAGAHDAPATPGAGRSLPPTGRNPGAYAQAPGITARVPGDAAPKAGRRPGARTSG